MTILFVSHRLPEVFRLCARITVLRDGQYVGTFDRDATTPDDDRARDGGPRAARACRAARRAAAARRRSPCAASRAARWCTTCRWRSPPGEIVGIFGLVGSGRTELLETIFGLARHDEGAVEVDRASAVPRARPRDGDRAPASRWCRRIASGRACFFNLNLRDNLMLPRCAPRRRPVRVRRAEERARAAAQACGAVDQDAEPRGDAGSPERRQPAEGAWSPKWLAIAPKVLLLDEPTKGVDVGAKFEIHNIIRARGGDAAWPAWSCRAICPRCWRWPIALS